MARGRGAADEDKRWRRALVGLGAALSAAVFLLLGGPVGDSLRWWALLAVLAIGVDGLRRLFAGTHPRDPAPGNRLMTANAAGLGFWTVASGTYVVGGAPPVGALVSGVGVAGATALLVWVVVPR